MPPSWDEIITVSSRSRSTTFPIPTFPLDFCWVRHGTYTTLRAYQYADSTGSPDGLKGLRVEVGAAPKSKVSVKAGGVYLRLPTLPMTPPVTVQVVNSEGECWEAVYGAADVSRNDSGGSPAIVRARTP